MQGNTESSNLLRVESSSLDKSFICLSIERIFCNLHIRKSGIIKKIDINIKKTVTAGPAAVKPAICRKNGENMLRTGSDTRVSFASVQLSTRTNLLEHQETSLSDTV